MELKVKLPSILNPRDYSWPASCTHQPKTLSFRSDELFAALNSAIAGTPFSLFTHYTASSSSSSPSSTTTIEASNEGGDVDEAIIRGAYSETTRLSFDPSPAKNLLPAALFHEEKQEDINKKKEKKTRVVAVAMESDDPYLDYSNSNEEIVLAHRWLINDWDSLEELLAWYLSANGTHNHHYIVGAFVDVLVKYSSSVSL